MAFPQILLGGEAPLLRNFWQGCCCNGFRVRKRCNLSHSGRHKILKTPLTPLSKAHPHWYIPAATQGHSPGVAFSGSLRTGSDAQALAKPVSASGFSAKRTQRFIAGWSSPVARQAHNLKVIGSNPIPATRQRIDFAMLL